MFVKTKARYWVAVLYPENMRPDWERDIGDILGLPYCYCVHNKDKDQQGDQRKCHVHLIIAFGNTTTESRAKQIIDQLADEGKVACPGVQAVNNIRHMYEYLIHNTETCKKKGKFLYKPSDRVCGNNFDVGDYEQLSTADKMRMSKELCDYICQNHVTNFADFYLEVANNFDDEYFALVHCNSGFYSRLIDGNWQKIMRQNSEKRK